MNLHDQLARARHEELVRTVAPRPPGSPGRVGAPRGLTTRRSYRQRALLVSAATSVLGLTVKPSGLPAGAASPEARLPIQSCGHPTHGRHRCARFRSMFPSSPRLSPAR